MREGPQNVQIALLLAGPRVRVLDMLAQRAIGTRCSRPLVASQPKQAAQTACSCAMQARGLQSTADGSAGGACDLVDDHRWPRQKRATEYIDGLKQRRRYRPPSSTQRQRVLRRRRMQLSGWRASERCLADRSRRPAAPPCARR